MASSMTRIASRGNTHPLEVAASPEVIAEVSVAAELQQEFTSKEITADPTVETSQKKTPKKKSINIKSITSESEALVNVKDEVPLTEKVSNSKKKRKTEKTK